MRKIIMLIVIICCATLVTGAMALDVPAKKTAQPMSFSAQTETGPAKAPASTSSSALITLKQDSGKNFSEMNLTLYSAGSAYGAEGRRIGEAVEFASPKPGWKLRAIQVLGWSGFNNTTKLSPQDRDFLIEVRDKDANLLYRLTDDQNNYFASSTGPVISSIDVPALPVTEDFYIVFYDRGSMAIGMEQGNGTGNSYFIANGRRIPAEFKTKGTNETIKVNWLIRAVGE